METPPENKNSTLELKKRTIRHVNAILLSSFALSLKYGELAKKIVKGEGKEAFSSENCPWRAAKQVYDLLTKEKS